MQFEFLFAPKRAPKPAEEWLRVGGRAVRLRLVRNRRARRYILRLARDGTARLTIPRGGSIAEAKRFANKNLTWLERQLLRQAAQPRHPPVWTTGAQILFRGEPVALQMRVEGNKCVVCFAGETVALGPAPANPTINHQLSSHQLPSDLRPAVEYHLRQLAARELPPRVMELAALHQFQVTRVTVRNQRSRWGSCSRRGTISLNWRLVQAPIFVRDYIILHELAHLKEMNHSARFWREVARLCPDFKIAEKWLKQHSTQALMIG